MEWKWLVHSIAIGNILWPFGNLVAIWYVFPHLGILCQETSGKPVGDVFLVSAEKQGDQMSL
jgi:hypothetical protein